MTHYVLQNCSVHYGGAVLLKFFELVCQMTFVMKRDFTI